MVTATSGSEPTVCSAEMARRPEGSKLASGSLDKTIIIWDAETGEQKTHLKGHTSCVQSVAWSPEGSKIASGSFDKTIIIWDAETGEQKTQLKGHTGDVMSVAWSPEGSKIASGSADKTVIIWDAKTGEQKAQLKGHTDWVRSVTWSPDGSKVASGSDDKRIIIWDAETGQQKTQLKGHTDFVYSVAWSFDGRKVASGSRDKTVIIWDAMMGKRDSKLEGHTNEVNSVTWSSGGSKVVSGSADNTVIISNSKTGEQISQLKGHGGSVQSVDSSGEKSKTALEPTAIMSAVQEGVQLQGHLGAALSAAPTTQKVAPTEEHFLREVDSLHLLTQTCLSISLKNLAKILADTQRDMRKCCIEEPEEGYTSEHVRRYFFDNKIFLLEKSEYVSLFSDEKPHVPVTYMWLGTSLRELMSILKDNFDEEALVWIDIVFNDQRRPEVVAKAVMAANGTYMTSKDHVVIFSRAVYPVFDNSGQVVGKQECEPWDRCWCLLEIALRDLAARKRGKKPSQIVLSDRYFRMLVRKYNGVNAKEAIQHMFAGKDFTQMQGRPEDVREISRMLSSDIFSSKEEFNKRIGEKLTEMLSSQLVLG